jgi:nucleoside phosphorylase/tetratricopeptide (TPR) repeat protein
MAEIIIGKNHSDLVNWLCTDWLVNGPSVCFIEGFSGVGKTSIARNVIKTINQDTVWQAVLVDVSDEGSGEVYELYFDLATKLSIIGIDELANAIDVGKPFWVSLLNVLQRKIVIVFDEFQRALSNENGKPLGEYWKLLAKIASWPNLPGRVLFLTNRLIERSKWSEAYSIRTITGLIPDDAEHLLGKLLTDARRSDEVPLSRRRDVVNWLGCNPRALHVFVASLERDSLDDLIGINPEIWEAKDRNVSSELLYKLEKELLERIIRHLQPQTRTLLRSISVYRKEITREAIEILLSSNIEFFNIREELISRFLLEQHYGLYSINPIVKEISLQRVKENPKDFQKAHSKAADYYSRHFTSRNITAGGKLAGYFIEARYHLLRSNRELEIENIASRFDNYIELTTSSPNIPRNINELNEKIVLLSVFLEDHESQSLEYYLAKLYRTRNKPGDIEKALNYSRRVTGRTASSVKWLFRIGLEEMVNGAEVAFNVCLQGINLSIQDKNILQVYERLVILAKKAYQIDTALDVLRKGMSKDNNVYIETPVLTKLIYELLIIKGEKKQALELMEQSIKSITPKTSLIPVFKSMLTLYMQTNQEQKAIELLKRADSFLPKEVNISSLYIELGDLMARKSDIQETLFLLQESMKLPPYDQRFFLTYQHIVNSLINAKKEDESIIFLEEVINRYPKGTDFSLIYFLLGQLLEKKGEEKKAVYYYENAALGDTNFGNSGHLYTHVAELLCQHKRIQSAITLLLKGVDNVSPEKGLINLYRLAIKLMMNNRRRDEAVELLYKGIECIQASDAYELYLSLSQILVKLGKKEDAIENLKVGINKCSNHTNVRSLYKECGDLLDMMGRTKEGIELLKEGIARISPHENTTILYQSLGEILIRHNKADDAAILLQEGISHAYNSHPINLYQLALKNLLGLRRFDESIALLKKGIEQLPSGIDIELLVLAGKLFKDTGREKDLIQLINSSRYFTSPTEKNKHQISILRSELKRLGYPDELSDRGKIIREYSSEALDYVPAIQSWYPKFFPITTEINENRIDDIKKDLDIVIITATEVEIRAVMNHLEPYSSFKSVLLAYVGPETYYLGKFGEFHAAVTKCRMGAIGEGSVILATEQAQRIWNPRAIIMVGIAFGKDPISQKIGDVIVASQVISYEQQRIGDKIIFRGPIIPSNTLLLNRFENVPGWKFQKPNGGVSNLIIGPLLSGEKLIDNPMFRRTLFKHFPQAVGGEMEGAGLCAASGRVGVPWILVKSICDWGDGHKQSLHQPLAAAAATSLVHYVLSQKTVLNSIDKK